MRPCHLKCEIPSEPLVARFRISSDRQIRHRQSHRGSRPRPREQVAQDGSRALVVAQHLGRVQYWRTRRFHRHRQSRLCHGCSKPWVTATASIAPNYHYHHLYLTRLTRLPSDGISSCSIRRWQKTQIDLGRYITLYTLYCTGVYPTICSYR